MANTLPQTATTVLIMMFIGVIITVTFIAQIGTDISAQTELITVTNESLDISSTRTGSGNDSVVNTVVLTLVNNQNVTGNFPISSFVLRNNDTGAIIVAANYTLDATFGNLTLVDNGYWNGTETGEGALSNITFANYQYKDINYVDDSSSRSVINLILIFAALAIVIFIIVLLFRKDGELNRFTKVGGG